MSRTNVFIKLTYLIIKFHFDNILYFHELFTREISDFPVILSTKNQQKVVSRSNNVTHNHSLIFTFLIHFFWVHKSIMRYTHMKMILIVMMSLILMNKTKIKLFKCKHCEKITNHSVILRDTY